MVTCDCAPDPCWFEDAGYSWCRSCGEHHRPPECPIDEQGRALAPCGHPWATLDTDPHRHERTHAMSEAPYVDPFPGQYTAPDGVESSLPGADVTALRDPSATNPTAAIAAAIAQTNAYEQTTHGQGSMVGVPIDLPSAQSPQ